MNNFYPGSFQPAQNFQQPAFQQPAQMAQNAFQQPSFVCRPVTSREEAVAVQVDFFGPGTLMPDIGHGVIYLKRFNQQTGASDFLEFSYAPPKAPEPQPEYATVEMLRELEAKLTKGAKKNVSAE